MGDLNKVLFPPRIAKSWTTGRDYKPANDNKPLMTAIETASGGVVYDPRSEQPLDQPARRAGRIVIKLGALVEDEASRKPDIRPVNDDAPARIDWPLAKALNSEDQPRLLKAAYALKRIEDAANHEPAISANVTGREEWMRLDQRTWIRPDGEIVYKGARQLRGKAAMRDQVQRGKQKSADDALADRIDAKPLLEELERRVGPLWQNLLLAVVWGWSLEAIGRHEAGHADKQRASAVGKAFVYRALRVVASYFEEPRAQEVLESLGLSWG